MEKRKKERGDGVFGWPISAFTILMVFIGIALDYLLTGTGVLRGGPDDEPNRYSSYTCFALGVIVEYGHYKWKERKDRNGRPRRDS